MQNFYSKHSGSSFKISVDLKFQESIFCIISEVREKDIYNV